VTKTVRRPSTPRVTSCALFPNPSCFYVPLCALHAGHAPHFDGETDPLPWINKCEHFFQGYRTMEEEKVWTASLHLDGAAAEWYFQLECDVGVPSWARFVEYINLRFGPPIRSNSLGELTNLRRSGSVEYQRRFLALLCRCTDLTMQHQIDLFTAGLGQPLSSDVELQRPSNLQMAMSLARAYERRGLEAAAVGVARTTARTRTPSGPGHHVLALPAPGGATKPDEPPRPRFRRLSPEEIAEKRASGQCYFCPEKFTKDHKCAAKGVFLLEISDEETPTDADADLGVSLAALTGIATPPDAQFTMKLRVRVRDFDLVALVDTGSTHTFIHDEVAQRLGLAVTRRPGLTVKVANGDRVPSQGVCRATLVVIDGVPFDVDCYTRAG